MVVYAHRGTRELCVLMEEHDVTSSFSFLCFPLAPGDRCGYIGRDFNTYDISFGSQRDNGAIRAISCWAYHRNYGTMLDVPDYTTWLFRFEFLVVIVAFLVYVCPDSLRAVQRLLSTFVDLYFAEKNIFFLVSPTFQLESCYPKIQNPRLSREYS